MEAPEARPADPMAKLLVHQRLQWLSHGRTSFGSTVASGVGSSWPAAPSSSLDGIAPALLGRTDCQQIPEGMGRTHCPVWPFPIAAWCHLRRQGRAERVRANPLTICPWIRRASPREAQLSLAGSPDEDRSPIM